MTSFTRLAKIFNMPQFFLLAKPSNETPHAEFVRELNEKHQHPSQLIESGLNPFKAWRQEYGETQSDMADILDMNLHDYISLERGDIYYTKNDVLNFCRHFKLQPYDLVPLKSSFIPPVIRDVLLDIYNNPDILPTNDDERVYKIEWMLIDEASPTLSIGRLQDIRNRLIDQPNESLTIHYIDSLITYDGSYRMGFIDDANVLLDEITEKSKLSKKPTAQLIVDTKAKKQKLWLDYNHLGNRLYREDWREAHARLMISKKIIGKSDVFFKIYAQSPFAMGLEESLSHTGTIVFERRHLDWAQAQKLHASVMRRYFDAITEENDLKLQFKNSGDALTHLEIWASQNKDLLARYNNRQVLMHHCNFKQVRPRHYGFDVDTAFEMPVSERRIAGIRTKSVDMQWKSPEFSRLFTSKIA